jgi:hypothetical protein
VNVDQERWDLRVHTAHLAHGINVESEFEFFRFAPYFTLKQFVAQLRLGVERIEFEIAL